MRCAGCNRIFAAAKKRKNPEEKLHRAKNEKITVFIITEHEGVVKSEKIHVSGF